MAGIETALRILVWATAGAATYFGWPYLGPPDEPLPAMWGEIPLKGVWRSFFGIVVPVAAAAGIAGFSVIGRFLGEGIRERWDEARRADHWTDLAAAAMMIPIFLWTWVGDWFLWCGIVFLSWVFIRTGLYGWALLQSGHETSTAGRGRLAALFAVPFWAYSVLALWIARAISTTGDEYLYLLAAVSLIKDGDIDLVNNVMAGDYASFLWARVSPEALQHHRQLGFPALIAPAFAAGGREGVLLFQSAAAAACGVLTYLAARFAWREERPALMAWGVLVTSTTLVVLSGQAYPEVLATMFLLLGCVLLVYVGRFPIQAGLAVGVAIFFLVFLKERFAGAAVALGIFFIAELLRKPGKGRIVLLGLAAGAACLLAVHTLVVPLFPNLPVYWGQMSALLPWKFADTTFFLGLMGVFIDQQYGLLVYSPLLAFAAFGWRRIPWRGEGTRPLAALLVSGLLYLVVLLAFRRFQWDAGWSPIARFLLVVTPGLAILSAGPLAAGGGKRILAKAALAWTAAVTFLMAIYPHWRYNSPNGRARILDTIGTALDTDVARFLPSFITLSPETPWVLMGGLLFAIVSMAVWKRRKNSSSDSPAAEAGGPRGALLILVLILAVLWLGRTLPTVRLEGEAMRTNVGQMFAGKRHVASWSVFKESGDLTAPVILKGGPTRFEVKAGAISNAPDPPRLSMWIDGTRIGGSTVGGDSGWRESQIPLSGDVPKGRHQLTLRVEIDSPPRGDGGGQAVFIDRIDIL